jgi:hypothetical protein
MRPSFFFVAVFLCVAVAEQNVASVQDQTSMRSDSTNSAKCANTDDTSGTTGTLSCTSGSNGTATSDSTNNDECPDTLVRITGKDGATPVLTFFSIASSSELITNSTTKKTKTQCDNFKDLISGSANYEMKTDEALVIFTKAVIEHPDRADKSIGFFGMKRQVCDVWASSSRSCSTYKVGYCIKCATDIFSSTNQKDATDAERETFIQGCAPYAFNSTTGSILDNSTCTETRGGEEYLLNAIYGSVFMSML